MNLLARFALTTALATTFPHAAAQPWEFDPALDVTPLHGPGIFHHLESSGRRSVAVSGTAVAVVWEDNHDGTPRVYLARKRLDGAQFDAAIRVSGEGEAFEPSIAALDGNAFVVAWEEDQRIHARVIAAQEPGPALRLSDSEAVQANLSVEGVRVYVLRSQPEGRYARIRLQVLRVDDARALESVAECAVDTAPLTDDQLYPASAIVAGALTVAWEDRRPGHTIIMASAARLDDPCTFRAPERVSEPRPEAKSGYGKGHGVSRVALASHGDSGLLAVWADKRSYWEGYDIYAADAVEDGRFGSNTKVQDEFGDFARQWHAAVAGHANGRLVVIWDDEREKNSDVMLSWWEDGTWSEDLPLPGASDDSQQTHPGIAIDAGGNLHAAWIERQEINGPTRLRYQLGRLTPE